MTISDNKLLDHSDHAMWMGAVLPLALDLIVLSMGPGGLV
jgi:hypothetical protein